MAHRSKSSWHSYFTTITPFSKTIAFVLFIILPLIGFYLGMQYQKTIDILTASVSSVVHVSTK